MEDEDVMPLTQVFKFIAQRTFAFGGDSSAYHRHRSFSAAPKHPRSLYCNTPGNGGKRSSLCQISREGNFVWAKVLPHTWRPGKVESFNGSLIYVSLFGCSRTISLDPSDILGFEESFPQMIKMNGVKLSREIDLALNEFARGNATGLKCHCGVSLEDEDGSSAVKRSFNPLEIIDFVIGKAVSPQAADEEIATLVRVSVSIIAFRHALVLCKTSEVDERFCAEGLLDFVGDVAICQFTDDKEIDGFDKAVAQLNSFRMFTSRKPDGIFQICWEFKNDSLESVYQGQSDYTSEDEMRHEMTKDPEVDVSVGSQKEGQFLNVNHKQNREMCVISMMDFSIFCMDENYESQIYDRHQVYADSGESAASDICRNTKHEKILYSCTEVPPVKMEVGADVHGSSLVNDTNETAASSICASVHDKLVITLPLNCPNHMLQVAEEFTFNKSIEANLENVKHESNDMHVCSDKYNSSDVLSSANNLLQQTVHLSRGQLHSFPNNNGSAFFGGEKYESQICDQYQVDVDQGQSAGRGIYRNTKHENILHSCTEDPLVKMEVGAKVHGHKNFSLVNDTNETAASSICASVHDKLIITPPLNSPDQMLQVTEEFTFNKSIVTNLENVKLESTDIHVCSDNYNSTDFLSSAKNILQQTVHLSGGQLHSFSINNDSAFLGGERYDSQIYDQYQFDADRGQSAGRGICRNTKHVNIAHSCMEDPSAKLEAGAEVQGSRSFSLLNDTNETAPSSICAPVHNKLVVLPSLTYPNHMLQVGEEVTSNRSMVEKLENVKIENTCIPVCSAKFNSVDTLSSAENLLQQTVHLSGGQLHRFPVNNGRAFSPSTLNLTDQPQSRAEIYFDASNAAQCANEIPQMVPLEKTALQSLANKRKVYDAPTENNKSPQTSASCFKTSAHSGSLLGNNNSAQVSNGNNKAFSWDNVETDAAKLGSCYDVNVSFKLNKSGHASKHFSTSSQRNHHHQSKWQIFYATPLIKDGLPSPENRLKSFDSDNCRTPTKKLAVKYPKDSYNCCTPKKKPTMKFPKDANSCSTSKQKLTIKFPKNYTLPSKDDLDKKFGVFGPLDHRKTQVFFYTGVGQVVFLNEADAATAFSYVTKNGIFGRANMRIWLSKAEKCKKENSNVPGTVHSSQNVKPCLKFSIPQLIDKRKKINHRVRFSTDL